MLYTFTFTYVRRLNKCPAVLDTLPLLIPISMYRIAGICIVVEVASRLSGNMPEGMSKNAGMGCEFEFAQLGSR